MAVAAAPRAPMSVGIGLALSGGGYRAMLFHVGALLRLNELGVLPKLVRVSSVSGGSITAAKLGLGWKSLRFDERGRSPREDFERELVRPIRELADVVIDRRSILKGIFGRGSIASKVEKAYRKHLFEDALLQDLPYNPSADVPNDAPDGIAGPRFVINATNLQTGRLWRFSRPYTGDYSVGRIPLAPIPLARAVAASSAFPPVLSPVILKLDPQQYTLDRDAPHATPEFQARVLLSDGGVYDNLGAETIWNHPAIKVCLFSDAGGLFKPSPKPGKSWIKQLGRVRNIVIDQTRALRKREIIADFKSGKAQGTYWGIATDIREYGVADCLPTPFEKTQELARIRTRLNKFSEKEQKELINWGYAICDTAMRKWVADVLPPPSATPSPAWPYREFALG